VKRIHIFKPGCHLAMSGQRLCFSASDIARTAAVYSPDIRRAAIVIGHPVDDLPALGWVSELQTEGDTLVAGVEDVSEDLVSQVRMGRYRKISAAFLFPDSPGNPTPGTYYLKDVGFLGAAAPAVHLPEVSFASPIRVFHPQVPSCGACSVAGPPGFQLDPDRLRIHRRALISRRPSRG
jgi:hypothetical protein